LPARALHTHVEALNRNPTAIASVGSSITFGANKLHRTVRIIRRRTIRRVFPDALFGWPIVSGQCLFRTQAVKSVNGWNESYSFAEDYDLWLRVGRLGPVVLLPDIVFKYRSHLGQWRPLKPEIRQLMTEIRQRALAPLDERERERAERILRARDLTQMAGERPGRLQAVGLYLKALRIAPDLLWSPLTRPRILASLRRCLVGRRGRRLGRLFASWTRDS